LGKCKFVEYKAGYAQRGLNFLQIEPATKLIGLCATRTVLGQALAIFQVFSRAKPRISRLLFQKLKFWESLNLYEFMKKECSIRLFKN
jgi:hypothetical protein